MQLRFSSDPQMLQGADVRLSHDREMMSGSLRSLLNNPAVVKLLRIARSMQHLHALLHMMSPLLSPGARTARPRSSKLPYVLLFCVFVALAASFANLQRCQSKLHSERELLRRIRSTLLLEVQLEQHAKMHQEIEATTSGESGAAAKVILMTFLGPLQAKP
jgi:hypothetical protein